MGVFIKGYIMVVSVEQTLQEKQQITYFHFTLLRRARGTRMGSKAIIHYDEEPDFSAEDPYAGIGTYGTSNGNGFTAEAGLLKAKQSNGNSEIGATLATAKLGSEFSLHKVSAMADVEVISVSAKAGPVDAKLGLGAKTGASIGADGVEVKVLGTGFTFGKRISVSVFGSEIGFSWS
ncbi:hypothetical protein AAFF_G00095200 [Aldrovandia affinis]|uniref:Uncharacterized protein n=1 Tax=Aldrovandia affinis TaxID=143900 RepID=A0AAD7RVT3_9TELE|nr:hypothetical protein AAFF_G00095200 [Aldrovandia affinis]